ncbi:hypoxanthine-guanine phosphoribosyltransferase [Oceanobacter mangrovi]|uniref:hypoxanthine-guanine phosphoribosyltransferase n=1 Tax=Oceanobacter mangrovi TaxID=2862510 RepID=UPI001C8E62D5|nr:hypoxanthine-guanine phosphoribosyltransferase [Oceanobacter mangrovi]
MSQELTQQELDTILQEADLLISPEQVDAAIDKLAAEITARLDGTMPVVYTVMNGGLMMAGYLLPKLEFALEVGYMHATRYRGETTGSTELQWQAPPSIPMQDRHVLILDDIFDEGHTLAEVVESCKQQGAKEVLTAVLCNKVHDRKTDKLDVDFSGLDLEDRYVFGFGMDYRGYWRNLKGIYAVKGL